jgi:transposase
MRWRIFDGALNSTILINFFKRLKKGQKKKMLLILDNLSVHHSKPVKQWLGEHVEDIEVFYLSTALNSILTKWLTPTSNRQ